MSANRLIVAALSWIVAGTAWSDVPNTYRNADETPLHFAMRGSDEAGLILGEALANPAVLDTDVVQALLREQAALYDQRFFVMVQGDGYYEQHCLRVNALTHYAVELNGFVNTGSCLGGSCEINLCPSSFLSGNQLTFTILHELGHVTEGRNECWATYVSLMAHKLAGRGLYRDGYVGSCNLDFLFY